MTDEEIIALAKQARQKYCDKYNEGIDLPTYHCEDNGCPLYRRMNHCGSEEYYIGVFDGFNAAYNIIKIDVNKLTIGDVKCAIEQSPEYAELLLRAIGEDFKNIYREIVTNNIEQHD